MLANQQEKVIRVGSRKSELALIQTKHVIGRLQKLFPKQKFEIHTMSTFGDRVLNISLPKIGEKSLFTRDLEDALRNGGVDFVVHSLKDLPTVLPLGMAVGAVLEREDARDALVLRENYKGQSIGTLPQGSVIGTSSLRRTAQIRRQYPHLVVCDIRGNLNTRLAKLDAQDSKFAGIILAQAGLVRMGWMNRISQVLEPTDLLYAVGQGALAVECRANDTSILGMLQKLMCISTTCRILAERSFLKTLGGGCSAPVAVWSNLNGMPTSGICTEDVGLSLTGAVWSLDGAIEIREHLDCALNEAENRKRTLAGTTENGLGNGNSNDNSNTDSSCDSSPAIKRARNSNSSPNSDSSSPRPQGSPPVINDDAEVEKLTANYNVGELIERHIDLARKCPIVGAECSSLGAGDGGGDADTRNANVAAIAHCPLQIDVGQDVMGECPFVNNETKVSYANAGMCPVTHNTLPTAATHTTTNISNGGDEPDNAVSNASKCPFAAMHQTSGMEAITDEVASTSHGKCPFLQKTVKMFDYADEEQPKPQQLPVLIEDVDDLFCGLYQHTCYNRELYVKSNRLGQTLADQLIQKGALDVMKVAQAEIHGKTA